MILSCIIVSIFASPAMATDDIAEAEEAVAAARETYESALDQYNRGSLGFFEYVGADHAVQIITEQLEENRRVVNDDGSITYPKFRTGADERAMPVFDLGGEGDSTSLENMKLAISMIYEGNELRCTDDNHPGLNALKVNDTMMAVAQAQTDASRFDFSHSSLYKCGENLAWGDETPYSGWYDEEKLVSDTMRDQNLNLTDAIAWLKANGYDLHVNGVGHYDTLVMSGYVTTGYAIASGSVVTPDGTTLNTMYGLVHGQVFSGNSGNYYIDSGEDSMTVEEYETRFLEYYTATVEAVESAAEALSAAEDHLDELRNFQFSEFIWSGSDDEGYTADARFVSTVDSSLEKLITAQINIVRIEATSTSDGSITYTASVTYRGETYTDSRVVVIPMKTVNISLNETYIVLRVGQTATISATVTGLEDTYQPISLGWSYINNGTILVATVNTYTLVISAINVGENKITVTLHDGSGKTAECTVVIEPTPVEEISLSETRLSMNKGDTARLTAVVSPDDATDKTVTWKSSNSSVATVDSNGNVKAVGAGNATITATAHDGSGIAAVCTVTVSVPLQGMSLSESIDLPVGSSEKLNVTFVPSDTSERAVTWTSSNTSVATVDDSGNVTGITLGDAVITAEGANGITASCTVHVRDDSAFIIDGTISFADGEVQYRGATPYVIYNKKAQTPSVTVTDKETGQVIDPRYYSVKYTNNTKPGTANVKVTFAKPYTGTCSAFFKIYLPATTATTVENRANGIQITWEPVEDSKGYVIYRRAWNLVDGGWTSFERWNNTTDTTWTDTIPDKVCY